MTPSSDASSSCSASPLRCVLLTFCLPTNLYIWHLDVGAPYADHRDLAVGLAAHPVTATAGNVRVVERANLFTYREPTMVASTLHAALLRGHAGAGGSDLDWFINLSASGYPLVPQDYLIHVLSKLPRDINFIDHTRNIGRKEQVLEGEAGHHRPRDLHEEGGRVLVPQRWSVPTTFKVFTDN